MNGTIPQPPAGGDPLAELRHQIGEQLTFTDWSFDQIERRIVALEELVAAPCWRGRRARARLRRSLRASVAGYGYAGNDWEAQRIEAAASSLLARR